MIISPVVTQPIVGANATMAPAFAAWASLVSDLSIIVGTGSPEGVIDAGITSLYMDDAGLTGSILYIKQLTVIGGDSSKGWVLV